jgi:predicted kinase
MNQVIEILVGIPASGKSTYAIEKVRNNSDYIRINRDSLRMMFSGSYLVDYSVEKIITEVEYNIIDSVLKSGKSIVIDNTHLRLKYIRPYFEKFTDRADIKINIFDISIEDAIERDINRGEKKVGKDVIERMYGNYLNLLPILEKEYKEYII